MVTNCCMSNKIKLIKNQSDYDEALKFIEQLMISDPDPDTEEGEKLSLLVTLVKEYESQQFPESVVGAIDAILFRMDQLGLKPTDLVPFIGSRSRVSEILSGKRQLTVEMMRSLEDGLGIPAKALLRKPDKEGVPMFANWSKHLLKEMSKRGYFGDQMFDGENGSTVLKTFFSLGGSPLQFQGLLRQTNYRSSPTTDRQALSAWAGCVLKKAYEIETPIKYKKGIIDLDFMRRLVKLSIQDKSPLLAQEFLKNHGIVLVTEPHFPKTRLDGAAMFTIEDKPVIGLTLRHDRLDNFWFTLMHELAHIALHYGNSSELFFDELDGIKGMEIDEKEKEADNLAGEALVPSDKWDVSAAKLVPSPLAANSLAKELGIHVAIIAGKIRHERGNYVYLNKIIGDAKVRHFFDAARQN